MTGQRPSSQHWGMASTAHGTASGSDNSKQAAHGPNILSMPADVLFTNMARDVLGDVAALRMVCRALRMGAAVVVAQSAQAVRLCPGGDNCWFGDSALALGAALGSALSQCQQPKNLRMSLTGDLIGYGIVATLDGMCDSGAHEHVAVLHLAQLWPAVCILESLSTWTNLRTLELEQSVMLEPCLGSSLAQLTGLQSLSLKLRPGVGETSRAFNESTVSGTHLRQLSNLTSLCFEVEGDSSDTQGAVTLIASVSALRLLRSLDLYYGQRHGSAVAAALAAALPALTGLTRLDFDLSPFFRLAAASGAGLLRAISALPLLQHLGMPRHCEATQCAHTLSGLTSLSSLQLGDGLTVDQESDSAQLLSQLTRLEVHNWYGGDEWPEGHAPWLAQLQEVCMLWVNLPVLARLPPDTRIMGEQGLIHTLGGSGREGDVRDAVTALLASPAIREGSSTLDVRHLRAEHCAAVRPLAEAVSSVRELSERPDLLPHMVGWQMKCLEEDAAQIQALQQLSEAAACVGGVHVAKLLVSFQLLAEENWAQGAAAVEQLCGEARGLQQLELKLPRLLPDATGAVQGGEPQQQLLQRLQQAVQQHGVRVAVWG